MERRAGVIIIGGGLSGLLAAAEAADAGACVELYESSDALGGRARTRWVKGFAFNQGPHALYRKGAFRLALDRLEIRQTGKSPNFDHGLAVSGGRINLLPISPAAIARTALLDSSERRALAGSLRAFLGETAPQRGESVSLYLDRLGTPPKLRSILEALVRVTTYCHAPDGLDAASAIDQVALGFRGVTYVDGGWGGLVEALSRRVQSLGVSVQTGRAAERIEPSAEGVTVRFADGTSRSSAASVLAVGPIEAQRLVPGAASLGRAADQARPMRSLCLDFGLSKLPASRRTYALGLTRPLYFSVHSAAARLAPRGAAMVHVARYLAEDGTAVRPADVAELEQFVDVIQPGWRELVVARQRLVGIVVAHDYPQAQRGGLAGRPAIGVPEDRRIFVAGDWVGAEGLLSDAAAASGTAAGRSAAACAKAVELTAPSLRRPSAPPRRVRRAP
ncbi:MAG: phytoene desaturase family protein [Caulobacteraceae bacterium]